MFKVWWRWFDAKVRCIQLSIVAAECVFIVVIPEATMKHQPSEAVYPFFFFFFRSLWCHGGIRLMIIWMNSSMSSSNIDAVTTFFLPGPTSTQCRSCSPAPPWMFWRSRVKRSSLASASRFSRSVFVSFGRIIIYFQRKMWNLHPLRRYWAYNWSMEFLWTLVKSLHGKLKWMR
jgi:hypothetical protein